MPKEPIEEPSNDHERAASHSIEQRAIQQIENRGLK
jgi:hypothetical protein